MLGPRDIVFVPDSTAKITFSRGAEAAAQTLVGLVISIGSMTEHDKLERYERSDPTEARAESRVIKVADSYEILEPQEAPDFRAYARILRKRLPTVLIVFSILFGVGLIATLKQNRCTAARFYWRFKRKSGHSHHTGLYELDSVPMPI